MVTGRLEQRSWETPEGERRTKVEIVADEIGPSLRFATAEVQRAERPDADAPDAEADHASCDRPAAAVGEG